jgi:putative tryptophan/tyrosine transport system substrate-binding protein
VIVLEVADLQQAARKLGIEVATFEIRRFEDIAAAIQTFRGQVDAIFVPVDPLFTTNRERIINMVREARLPTAHGSREFVETGGLLSYGPNLPDLWRRAAEYVDKILRGTKPVDLPVQQPTKFEFVINLKTAKALGLIVPPTLLARADEVIE